MSDTNTIVIKRSTVPGKPPSVSDLQFGELAANLADGKLFLKAGTDDNSARVVQIGQQPTDANFSTVTGMTSLALRAANGGILTLNGYQWPDASTGRVTKGYFLGAVANNTADFIPFYIGSVGSDSLTSANLSAQFPSALPSQKVLGPTVIYECVASSTWRTVGYIQPSTSVVFGNITGNTSLSIQAGSGGTLTFNGYTWPTASTGTVDKGYSLFGTGANVLDLKPVRIGTSARDDLTTSDLNAAYPNALPAQFVTGPSTMYMCVGQNEWRPLGYPNQSTSVNLSTIRGTPSVSITSDVGGTVSINGISQPASTSYGQYVVGKDNSSLMTVDEFLGTVSSDTLTPTDLNSQFPNPYPGQYVIGPTSLYKSIGSGNWRSLGYTPIPTSMTLVSITGGNSLSIQAGTGGLLSLNGYIWPAATTNKVTKGYFLAGTNPNTTDFIPMYLGTVATDTQTQTQLNTAYPAALPGQKVTGPATIYENVSSGNWRTLGYTPPATSLSLRQLTQLFNTVNVSSSVLSIDCSYNTHFITMSTSATSVAFSNVPSTNNTSITITLIFNSPELYTVGWPSTIKWQGGVTPAFDTQYGAVSVIVLTTFNNGTSWLGSSTSGAFK